MAGYINYPALRFKRAKKLAIEELYKIFEDDEIKMKDWQVEVLTKFRDIEDLNEKFEHINRAEGDLYRLMLNQEIDRYTSDGYDIKRLAPLLGFLTEEKNDIYKSFECDEDHIHIKTSYGKMNVVRISDCFPFFRSIIPEIKTKERGGKCHVYVIDSALNWPLPNKLKICTGYASDFSKKAIYLHSWLEMEAEDDILVLDPTRNLVMNKQAYYNLNGVTNSVYKIPRETFVKEQKIFSYLLHKDPIYAKLYLANRHRALMIYKGLKSAESIKEKPSSVKGE